MLVKGDLVKALRPSFWTMEVKAGIQRGSVERSFNGSCFDSLYGLSNSEGAFMAPAGLEIAEAATVAAGAIKTNWIILARMSESA